jgi:hypothetical protein
VRAGDRYQKKRPDLHSSRHGISSIRGYDLQAHKKNLMAVLLALRLQKETNQGEREG